MTRPLRGIFAALPTPLMPDRQPDLAALPALLDDLVAQGCHGALVLGTTGEGPSFALTERAAILDAAVAWRAASGQDAFVLLGGTGCANVPETIDLSRQALALGYDAVLLLPPFYFKQVTALGVTRAFADVLEALPEESRVLLYHIPSVTGVPIGSEVLTALRAAFGPMVAGVKDSGAVLEDTRRMLAEFPELALFTGTDSHLVPALDAGAVGAITALASACGELLRTAYDRHSAGGDAAADSARLTSLRQAVDPYPLVPAVKALVHARRGQPLWPVRAPLVDLTPVERDALASSVAAALA
jgi:4-hydroxy-tetrahydrodipicolinate synthase